MEDLYARDHSLFDSKTRKNVGGGFISPGMIAETGSLLPEHDFSPAKISDQ